MRLGPEVLRIPGCAAKFERDEVILLILGRRTGFAVLTDESQAPELSPKRQNARVSDQWRLLEEPGAARAQGAEGLPGRGALGAGLNRVTRSKGRGGPSQVTDRAERTPCLWGECEAGCPHAWALRVVADRPARRPKQKPPPLEAVAARTRSRYLRPAWFSLPVPCVCMR